MRALHAWCLLATPRTAHWASHLGISCLSAGWPAAGQAVTGAARFALQPALTQCGRRLCPTQSAELGAGVMADPSGYGKKVGAACMTCLELVWGRTKGALCTCAGTGLVCGSSGTGMRLHARTPFSHAAQIMPCHWLHLFARRAESRVAAATRSELPALSSSPLLLAGLHGAGQHG